MHKIIDEPGNGKTTRGLIYAEKNELTYVCSFLEKMIQKALWLGSNVNKIKFVTYDEYLNKEKTNEKFYIDDIDLLLNHLPGDIQGYNAIEH